MKVNLLPIHNTFATYISSIIILTLAVFMTTPHLAAAATIAAGIDAGKHLITNGDTLIGPDGTSPGGDGFSNPNATSNSFIDASWQGQFLDQQNGSSYEHTVFAAAQISHLQVRARALSSPTVDEVYFISNSNSAGASWQDSFIITTVGATSGFMSFDLFLTGTASAYGAGWQYEEAPGYFANYDAAAASWRLDVSLQGGALLGQAYDGSQTGYSGYYGDPLSVSIQNNTIPIQFGSPFELNVSLNAWARADATPGESSMAEISILNSLEWGGITSVVDANGNPVEFSLSSASGYDYRLPFSDSASSPVVPIPPAIILFISGLLGLAVAGRRKSNAQ